MKKTAPSAEAQLLVALADARRTAFYPVSHLNRTGRRKKENRQAVADCEAVYKYLAEDLIEQFKSGEIT